MRMDENRLESTSKSCNAVCLLFSIYIYIYSLNVGGKQIRTRRTAATMFMSDKIFRSITFQISTWKLWHDAR